MDEWDKVSGYLSPGYCRLAMRDCPPEAQEEPFQLKRLQEPMSPPLLDEIPRWCGEEDSLTDYTWSDGLRAIDEYDWEGQGPPQCPVETEPEFQASRKESIHSDVPSEAMLPTPSRTHPASPQGNPVKGEQLSPDTDNDYESADLMANTRVDAGHPGDTLRTTDEKASPGVTPPVDSRSTLTTEAAADALTALLTQSPEREYIRKEQAIDGTPEAHGHSATPRAATGSNAFRVVESQSNLHSQGRSTSVPVTAETAALTTRCMSLPLHDKPATRNEAQPPAMEGPYHHVQNDDGTHSRAASATPIPSPDEGVDEDEMLQKHIQQSFEAERMDIDESLAPKQQSEQPLLSGIEEAAAGAATTPRDNIGSPSLAHSSASGGSVPPEAMDTTEPDPCNTLPDLREILAPSHQSGPDNDIPASVANDAMGGENAAIAVEETPDAAAEETRVIAVEETRATAVGETTATLVEGSADIAVEETIATLVEGSADIAVEDTRNIESTTATVPEDSHVPEIWHTDAGDAQGAEVTLADGQGTGVTIDTSTPTETEGAHVATTDAVVDRTEAPASITIADAQSTEPSGETSLPPAGVDIRVAQADEVFEESTNSGAVPAVDAHPAPTGTGSPEESHAKSTIKDSARTAISYQPVVPALTQGEETSTKGVLGSSSPGRSNPLAEVTVSTQASGTGTELAPVDHEQVSQTLDKDISNISSLPHTQHGSMNRDGEEDHELLAAEGMLELSREPVRLSIENVPASQSPTLQSPTGPGPQVAVPNESMIPEVGSVSDLSDPPGPQVAVPNESMIPEHGSVSDLSDPPERLVSPTLPGPTRGMIAGSRTHGPQQPDNGQDEQDILVHPPRHSSWPSTPVQGPFQSTSAFTARPSISSLANPFTHAALTSVNPRTPAPAPEPHSVDHAESTIPSSQPPAPQPDPVAQAEPAEPAIPKPKPRSKLPSKRSRYTRARNPSSSRRKDKDYKPEASSSENEKPPPKRKKVTSTKTTPIKAANARAAVKAISQEATKEEQDADDQRKEITSAPQEDQIQTSTPAAPAPQPILDPKDFLHYGKRTTRADTRQEVEKLKSSASAASGAQAVTPTLPAGSEAATSSLLTGRRKGNSAKATPKAPSTATRALAATASAKRKAKEPASKAAKDAERSPPRKRQTRASSVAEDKATNIGKRLRSQKK